MSAPLPSTLQDYDVKERAVRLALLVGVLHFCLKLTATLIGNSVTQVTDLLRSTGDTLACLFTWLTLRRITKGKALGYQYGFGKLENASSLIMAGVMVISFSVAIFSAIERFRHPVVVAGIEMGFFVAIYAAAIDTWVWRRTYRQSREDRSPVLESQWHLFRVKTLANLCVVLSLGFSLLLQGLPWIIYIDPVASMVVAGFLVYSIYSIVSVNVSDLLDRALDESLQLIILRELATCFDDYVAFHGMRSRRAGKHVYIEIFLEFDGTRTMVEVQKVIDMMKAGLEQKIPGSHVVIAPTTSRVV